MPAERFDVYIGSDLVGTIEWIRRRGVFEYEDQYREGAEATPLSLSMPTNLKRHTGRAVEAFLWGLLPDNDAVLQRWARQFQVTLSHPLGLVAAVGQDLPGAVSVAPTGKPIDRNSGSVEGLSEKQIGEMLARVRKDQTAWLGEGRWSLAGAQAKIALLETDTGWGRPTGAIPTNRILKPAIEGLADHDINEHLCLTAARKLGLRAAKSRVMTFGPERAIVVDRFDRRTIPTGGVQRFHQEDLCQALGIHPSSKYQGDGGPSAADIVRVIREHVDIKNEGKDVSAFVDALIFNWLIAAPDAHAKNYSLLLHGSGVRLAPLYDVASALPYPEFHTSKIKMAMKIGGYYKVHVVSVRAWERFAGEVDLDADRVVQRVRELSDHVGDAFRDAESEMEEEAGSAKGLTDQVAEWVARCRKKLT